MAIGKPTDEIATAFMRLGFHRSKQLLWRLGNCAPSRIRSHKRVGAGAPHLHVKLRLPTGRALRALFCTRVLVANARLAGRRASEQMGPTSDANSQVGLDNGREYSVLGEWSDTSKDPATSALPPWTPVHPNSRGVGCTDEWNLHAHCIQCTSCNTRTRDHMV